MKGKILIAYGDFLLNRWIGQVLEKEGYEIDETAEREQLLRKILKDRRISMIILGLVLPEMESLEILKEIRRHSQCPVILMSDCGNVELEVKALRCGADDFMTKPFNEELLIARVQAILRNRYKNTNKMIRIGKLEVDELACKVYVNGRETVLTNKEYRLLLLLFYNHNIVMSREKILEKLWGFDYEGDIRTIDTHIKMLRTDLGECGEYIKTVRGMGYLLEKK